MKRNGSRIRRVTVLAVISGALFLAPSAAAGPCWQQVIDDWADNSRVDGRYPVHCYREALTNMPEDMRAYSSAPDDIERAMREEIRRQNAAAGDETDEAEAPAITGSSGSAGPKKQTREKPEPSFARELDPGEQPPSSGGIFVRALDEIGPRDASSFPLPILVLGLLAAVLMTIGAVGFLARRLQGARIRPSRR